MDNLFLIFSIILIFIVLILIYFLIINSKNKKSSNFLDSEDTLLYFSELVKDLKNEIKTEIRETRKELDLKLHEGQKEMSESVRHQFTSSQKLISDIHEHLGKVNESVIEVKEGNKQVFSMTEQLSNLEKVLTNQKHRGNWGEGSLELILSNFLPNSSFHMQHGFKDGDIVDAVILVKEKFLPIDSKFSLDNYRRAIDSKNEDRKYFADEFKKDLKKRIEETSKYIKENENTLPLAFMFIPSEAIYHDLLAGEQSQLKVNTQSLIEFAHGKKVFIVSPTSIIAYLHLVLSGIKAFTIEKEAEQIQKKVEELGKHIFEYQDYMQKLGSSISTTVNHYNNASIKFKKIDKDIYKGTDKKSLGEIDLEKLERPINDWE